MWRQRVSVGLRGWKMQTFIGNLKILVHLVVDIGINANFDSSSDIRHFDVTTMPRLSRNQREQTKGRLGAGQCEQTIGRLGAGQCEQTIGRLGAGQCEQTIGRLGAGQCEPIVANA